jgi:anti-sigma regulatory factor (Ser/Thr protein kinase)
VLIAAFSWRWAIAATAVPGDQQIIHESWTFKDGAPDAVWALAQTADGYIWLGAAAGPYRFDGIRFELFRSLFGDQLLTNNISWLFAPPADGLWAGNVTGGVNFLKNGRITNFPEVPGTVYSFAQDRQGVVWAATDGGLWRFDGATWQQIGAVWNAPQKPVSQVGVDREAILWALTESRDFKVAKQLYYLPLGGRQFRKAGDNLFVQGLTLDADNAVLTTHQRRPKEPASGVELESSLPAYPIPRKNSEQILDRANGIWFLSIDPFIFRHAAGDPLADFVSKASPANSQVSDIDAYRYASLVDREGFIWIGDSTGVHRFSLSPLIQPQFPKPQRSRFTVAPDDGGVMWISAGDGTGSSTLYRAADGKTELKSRQGGLTNFAYRALDRTFWFAGEGGLWHMVNGSLKGLRESTVQKNDLALAISTIGEEFATDLIGSRLVCRVSVEGVARNLHPILRDEIYRIAAEALRNAFRHAQARKVEVEIRYDEEQFRLRVRDDGKGIDAALLSRQDSEGHYGLPGMRERAALIRGELTVWSKVDVGTEVELRVSAPTAYTSARRASWLSQKFAEKA